MKRVLFFLLLLSWVSFSAAADDPAKLPLTMPVSAPTPLRLEVTPPARLTKFDRVFKIIAWPGYGELNHGRKLERVQAWVLLVERGTFAFDTANTDRMLSTPPFIPAYTATDGLHYGRRDGPYETIALNTLFGNRNRVGVTGMLVGYELAYSSLSDPIPRWMEHKWGKKGRIVGRIAGIALGIFLTGEQVRGGLHNISLRRTYMQNYSNYLAGLPPVGH